MKHKKIAYIINHATFFASHILPQAEAAKKNGYKVKLFCGNLSSKSMNVDAISILKKKKINYLIFNFNSTSLNIFNDFFVFFKILKKVKEYKPDIVHVATAKGQLYGGLISKILKIKSLIILISGMGYLFSNKLNFFERLARLFYLNLQKIIFTHKNKFLITENYDDYAYFKKKFFLKKNEISLIFGSGVNLKIFKKIKNREKNKTILFVGRILEEKGIFEFVQSAEIIKKKFSDWKFIAAGATDYSKSSAINKNFINLYSNKKIIDFVNHQKNIYKLLKKSSIVCLPSYREGLPKSLCEAAACGLPVITSNVIGCKDAIIPKVTGELCLPKNVNSLARKIEFLINNKKLRIFYGNNGIKLAKSKFDIKIIINTILLIYKKALSEKK